MVEGEKHVGDHQRHVGEAQGIRVRLAQRLDRADEVVAEEPDSPADERRQPVDRRQPEALQVLGHGAVGIGGEAIGPARLGEHPLVPAQGRSRPDPDERVAADLPLLGGLEKEAGGPLRLTGAQLEEGRDRGLAIVDETGPDRHHVALLGELASLLEARLEPQGVVNLDGH
jgi:hypothetical protein